MEGTISTTVYQKPLLALGRSRDTAAPFVHVTGQENEIIDLLADEQHIDCAKIKFIEIW